MTNKKYVPKCNNETKKCPSKSNTKNQDDYPIITTLDTKDERNHHFDEMGMLQTFFHSPSSILPIRDVLDEQDHGNKPEPHIEIGAENYRTDCYQNNIKRFIKSNRKYIFLITTCHSNEYNQKSETKNRFYEKQFIIGFISREFILTRKSSEVKKKPWFCVKGTCNIYSFEDAIPIQTLWDHNFSRKYLIKNPWVDEQKTQTILTHFNQFDPSHNILQQCVDEIRQLDTNYETCDYSNCLFHGNGCIK